jgi:DNA repair exonuclease SbcCD ATPase subunit
MTLLSERIDNFSSEIKKQKESLIKLKGVKEQLEKQIEEAESSLINLQDEQKINSQASLFMLSEIVERRQKQLEAIQAIATSALQQIYGDEYSLKFDTFEEQRKDGANNFRIEIKIVSPHNGQTMETGLLNERGGGLIEVVSFALRIAALKWLKYDGPILLDEAWKSMSNDYKIDQVVQFLREVTDSTGRQVILVTHMFDKFGPEADNIVHITKADGVASAGLISYQEGKENEEW